MIMSNFQWLDGLGLEWTKLPQLTQQELEKSGQLKPNKEAMPKLPQHAPAHEHDSRAENDIPSSLEGVGRESNSAAEKEIQESWEGGFLVCWQLLWQAGLLVHPAQQAGQDCRGCKHITMTTEHHEGTRRKFFWRCGLGHSQLEIGLNGERVIIAPPGCRDHEVPEENKCW
jgi:hypothetical protein